MSAYIGPGRAIAFNYHLKENVLNGNNHEKRINPDPLLVRKNDKICPNIAGILNFMGAGGLYK